ncbi:MAG: hypothetical protein E7277_05280 [Lachnospiraceae bacterium]|nr:hypothetical protein [Lachnospiraceae bacterium]
MKKEAQIGVGRRVGKILAGARAESGASLHETAYGLCTVQALSKMEKGMQQIYKLDFDVILERLNKNPDNFECVLSKKEYEKMAVRENIEEAILFLDGERAREGLVKLRSLYKMSRAVERMFFYRTEGFYYLECEKNYSHAKESFKEALKSVALDYKKEEPGTERYSTWEVETLLGYGKACYQLGEADEASKVAQKCYSIACRISDEGLRARVYPKCVYYRGAWCDLSNEERIQNYEEALMQLRKNSISYFIIPLKKRVVALYKKSGNSERASYWERLVTPLEEIEEVYNKRVIEDAIFFRDYSCVHHLDYKIIRGERHTMGLTQESMMAGIYENQSTFSDIENGKCTMNGSKFSEIMERLGMVSERQSSFVPVYSFAELELIWKIRQASGRDDVEEVERLLASSSFLNPAMAASYKIVNSEIAKANEEICEELSKMLEKSYPMDAEIYYRPPFQWEMDAIVTCGIVAGKKCPEEILAMIEKLRNVFLQSDLDKRYCYREYGTILYNQIWVMSKAGMSEALHDVTEEGFRYSLECGKGGMLSRCAAAKAMEEGISNEMSVRYAHYAVIFAELYYKASINEYVDFYEWIKREGAVKKA